MKLSAGASIGDDGVWSQVISRPEGAHQRPGLFLDRDGAVVEEADYLRRPEDVRLIPGAAQVIAQANRLDLPVAIVTNQAGIAYGLYGWDEFIAVEKKIHSELATAGAFVNGVFACPHHQNGRPPFNHPDHPARKPNPGMLLAAADRLGIELAASWIVGDRASDLLAGKNAGLAGGMHVITGHGADKGERQAALALAEDGFQVLGAPAIADALTELALLKG
ncbi:MAG TPA: HAD family hydrolase [Rhodospirillales bacterium]|jgi:D-glycero-D-manno-heptose 1,7-bisphosphate phosphatase|nr:HAD family hydrolase [Rhodospirillales bacterium]